MTVSGEFLRPSELAPLLGVGPSRVYQLIRAGLIPATRVGGAIRIPRTAWEAWVREKGEEAISSLSPRKGER
jgi:excisionase family DNA binding protein